MLFQVNIPDPLWGRLQILADKTHVPVENVFFDAIDYYINTKQSGKIPNAETIEAMTDGDRHKNLKSHKNIDALFKSWDAVAFL
ncbi:MAG: hypothetical protein ACK48P_07220 [Holosporales bacterium]|jgi:predicted transcriptional regulator